MMMMMRMRRRWTGRLRYSGQRNDRYRGLALDVIVAREWKAVSVTHCVQLQGWFQSADSSGLTSCHRWYCEYSAG